MRAARLELKRRIFSRPAGTPVAQHADTLLTVDNLTARYGSTVAVRDVSLDIKRGEVVAILGANGAGKSTTLNTIVGLVTPADGTIVFEGERIEALPTERIVKRGISLVPEGRQVFATLTVEENLRIGAGLDGQRDFEQRRGELLELFTALQRKLGVFAGLLSGGEQQQLAIARSLMSDPKLLLLDEPSLGLAPIIVEQVFELIRKLRDQGTTLILAEQNVDKALRIADRAYVFSTGRVELVGAAAELRADPVVEQAYLGLGVPDEDGLTVGPLAPRSGS
jgi:branched-chain amino acid transport system ATP-binding protein